MRGVGACFQSQNVYGGSLNRHQEAQKAQEGGFPKLIVAFTGQVKSFEGSEVFPSTEFRMAFVPSVAMSTPEYRSGTLLRLRRAFPSDKVIPMRLWTLLFVSVLALALPCSAEEKSIRFPWKLNILTRKEWSAKPPVGEMTAHTPHYITIHHTATRHNPKRSIAEKLRGLQAFSQREDKLATGKIKPAWPDVPYHFYIACNGRIAEGRDLRFVPNTNTSYDPTTHITIVLEGNFEEEIPTSGQMSSTRALVTWLAKEFNVAAEKIGGHKDYTGTACPGKNLYSKLEELRRIATTLKPAPRLHWRFGTGPYF
jgi:hypothetical protein